MDQKIERGLVDLEHTLLDMMMDRDPADRARLADLVRKEADAMLSRIVKRFGLGPRTMPHMVAVRGRLDEIASRLDRVAKR